MNLLVAFALAVPSAALEPPGKRLDRIFDGLLEEARRLDLESHLPGAQRLRFPYEGDAFLLYEPKHANVTLQCRGANGIRILEGDSPAAAVTCGPVGEDEKDTAWVGVGRGVWHVGEVGNDERKLDARVAFALSHEIGHVMLRHGPQTVLHAMRLYRSWRAANGALAARLLREESRRYDRQADGSLSAADRKEVHREVGRELAGRFLAETKEDMEAFARAAEREADRYAGALALKAGYDPAERGPALHGLWEGYLLEKGGIDVVDPQHDPVWERAWSFFLEDLPGSGKGP